MKKDKAFVSHRQKNILIWLLIGIIFFGTVYVRVDRRQEQERTDIIHKALRVYRQAPKTTFEEQQAAAKKLTASLPKLDDSKLRYSSASAYEDPDLTHWCDAFMSPDMISTRDMLSQSDATREDYFNQLVLEWFMACYLGLY